jgi:hypothetical protein
VQGHFAPRSIHSAGAPTTLEDEEE